jgi:large subunit ribosomal protein L4
MTSLSIATINFNNQSVGSKEITLKSEFKSEISGSVAYSIRWSLAKRRVGSAKTKTMAEISGTTAKPWKQKGTGRARQGSRRSVQFVGGRTCHGPTNKRVFDFSLPKKIAEKALTEAINLKLNENRVVLFSGSADKTSVIQSLLKNQSIRDALIVFNFSGNESLVKSVRNIRNVKALDEKAINTYDILNHDHLLIDDGIFQEKILTRL